MHINKTAILTKDELRKIHVRSGHPHWRRMASFLKRPRPDRCSPDMKRTLRQSVGECRACNIYGVNLRQVRASIPHEDGRFN